MEKKCDKNGGPVFPQSIDHGTSAAGFPVITNVGGITLRDYAELSILQGMAVKFDFSFESDHSQLINYAKAAADIWLKARKI